MPAVLVQSKIKKPLPISNSSRKHAIFTVPRKISPISYKDWTPAEEALIEAMEVWTLESALLSPPRSDLETAQFINAIGPMDEREVYDLRELKGDTADERALARKRFADMGNAGEGYSMPWWKGLVEDMRKLFKIKATRNQRVPLVAVVP